MDKIVKEKWLAALRSGHYKQTTGCLRDNKGFCCLGVLCDLYIKEHEDAGAWHPVDRAPASRYTMHTVNSEASIWGLPLAVSRWADIKKTENYKVVHTSNPTVMHDGGLIYLSAINDDGTSFEEIAKIIEEQF